MGAAQGVQQGRACQCVLKTAARLCCEVHRFDQQLRTLDIGHPLNRQGHRGVQVHQQFVRQCSARLTRSV